jgi:hypothetical protein
MSVMRRVANSIGEFGWPAGACALIAIVAYASDGDAITAKGGVSLQFMLGMYAACAIVSGTVLGLLRPLATGWLGEALVSIPVAWPAAFSITVMSHDGRIREMDALDFWISIGLAAFLGPVTAAYIHIRRQK